VDKGDLPRRKINHLGPVRARSDGLIRVRFPLALPRSDSFSNMLQRDLAAVELSEPRHKRMPQTRKLIARPITPE